MTDRENANVREAWNRNAEFWNERMADGNDFFNLLVWPAVERLLCVTPGDRILDLACGNGVTSRRLAALGAKVVALDFSERMIALARDHGTDVDYRMIDATDYAALIELGKGSCESALCNMALMDMATIEPLMRALPHLLSPEGIFVFSVLHPCFNNPGTVQMAELEDRDGVLSTTYSVKISQYLTPYTQMGAAMPDQPAPHPYFHRPLSALIGAGLDAGFVLDGLVECAFPREYAGGSTPVSWNGNFSEIPPVVVVRLRCPPARPLP
jgi:2-polyprenyl-3-methyl-5-hydroxy-6-metoxy-1,4-benzoquinol methylase